MKIKIFILIASTFLLNTASAQSGKTGLLSHIGLQAYYHHYEEPGVMEQSGPFIGVNFNFALEREFYAGIEGLLSIGQVDYTSESTGSMDGKSDVCFEVRGIIGSLKVNRGFSRFLPYTGIGYRYLSDDSANKYSTTGEIGYLRVANYIYAPFGIRVSSQINRELIISAEAEYDLFIYGRQYSYTGYIAGYDDIENDQHEGYGYRFSLGLIRETKVHTYEFKVFYRYWDIEDSDVTYDSDGDGYIEPKNSTVEIGISASVLF